MAKTAGKTTGKHTYPRDLLLHWYEEMLLQRRFEEKSSQMYMQQKIKGFCHLYIGQEAVSSGIEAAIRKDDYVITAYRDHGTAIVRGVTPRAVMAEMFGKATGCVKGKGGSMHMFSKEHNMMGGHAIVGGQIPLGTGFAFAAKYREEDRICVCMMGDGAVRQGAFHEALNLAATWKLPVLYVIENNGYSMGTSVARTSNVTELYKLAGAYDIPSWPVDGMNVFSVYEELKKAADQVREEQSPVLIEIKTYRYRGHSMSDPAKYRTKEELEEYKDKDPLVHLKSHLIENHLATEPELDAIDEKVKAIVEDSVEFAEASPYPDPQALYEDVYSQKDYPYIMD